ncbi:MAG: secretin N-terminal domain-containing protein, partial [bacterium]
NSLIVFAPRQVLRTIESVVEALDVPDRSEITTFKIFRLQYAPAEEIARIVREIKQPVAQVAGEGEQKKEAGGQPAETIFVAAERLTNSLIVFAPRQVLRTIESVVEALDVPGGVTDNFFKIYRLQYASAEELADLLQDVRTLATLGALGDEKRKDTETTRAVLIRADVPTNSLIVFGTPRVIQTIDELVEALDIPGRIRPRTFKVYRLEHASAVELVKVLTEVKEGAEETSESELPAKSTRLNGVRPQGMTISADPATNSIIVFGTAENIDTMDKIIAQLDIRRPQVFVEALIMELTLEKSLQLGINWQASAKVGDAVVGGGFPSAQPQTLPDALTGGGGAALGIIGDQIDFQGQKFSSFSAFIQATRQDLDLNILANPQILTLDNEEAVINVSQVIPVSSKVVRDANFQSTTEFEFKDVGVILTIKPQITGTNKVLLHIKQETSSVASRQVTTSTDQTAITTLKRTIDTKVLIDDGATMAIGGLIQDSEIVTETKVPCLGDIPVIGWFFKSRSEEVRKTNLIVLLRPHIINSREDLEKITRGVQRRYDAANQVTGDVEALLRESLGVPPVPPDPGAEPEERSEE